MSEHDVRCFFLEPTGFQNRYLRRYADGEKGGRCPKMDGVYSYHTVMKFLGRGPVVKDERGVIQLPDWGLPKSDPAWPMVCICGHPFEDADNWQPFGRELYRRQDTGAEMTLEDAPPGAMWHADWRLPSNAGPDGHVLMVKCPGGHEWCIDARASNCTLPLDNAHRCWVRHGSVPEITVDKHGLTCHAGAGSIQTQNWHGFLTRGVLSTNRNPR